jgi:hypothetical protein
MLPSAEGYTIVVVIVAALYAFSLVALRFAGRRIRSHVRPIDLTALLLMTDVLRGPLSLDDKGMGAEIAVALTLCACARITTLLWSGRWLDRIGVWLLEPVREIERPVVDLASTRDVGGARHPLPVTP